MRSTFRLPDGMPEAFIEELRKHNTEEMAQFPVFPPALYEKHGSKNPCGLINSIKDVTPSSLALCYNTAI